MCLLVDCDPRLSVEGLRICWLHNFNNARVSKLSLEAGITKVTTANQVISRSADVAGASK